MNLKKPSPAIIGERLIISPTYVSNGCWVIPRAALPVTHQTDAALQTLATGRIRVDVWETDERIDRTTRRPETGVVPWTVTPFRYVRRPTALRRQEYTAVLVTAPGQIAAIDSGYADWLGLVPGQTIDGRDDAHGPFWLASGAVVMPTQTDARDSLDALMQVIGPQPTPAGIGT